MKSLLEKFFAHFSKSSMCLLLILGFANQAFTQTPADQKANQAVRKLYRSLHHAMNDSLVLFGHQDDLAYGIGWKYQKGESDVRRTVGSYPAVFGWDLGHLELGEATNLDSVPFDRMRDFIKTAHKMGSINTISWHLRNPENAGTSWDTSQAIRHVLPGGAKHEAYLAWIDKVADFMNSLKTGFMGKKIPVIFRPYHEHTGSWFWWGKKLCTPEEYIALWRMTVDRLKAQGVNNLLYAYSPAEFNSASHYLERYPGDAYVDVIGFDTYHRNPDDSLATQWFTNRLASSLATMTQIAKEHQKVMVLSETGCEQVPVQNWWTSVLWNSIKNYQPAYVLVWRNGRPDHFYAPYPGHLSQNDFKAFQQHPRVFFQDEWKARKRRK